MSSEDMSKPTKLSEALDHAVEETEDQERITLGELLESFGHRSHGPLLLVPSVIAMIPIIGGIPGVSIITGTIIVLVSVQMLFSRSRPWLPQRLLDFSISEEKFCAAVKKTKRWIAPLEKLIRRRLVFLTRGPLFFLIPIFSLGLGLLFYPTAFIPWGVTFPGFAVLIIALGLTTEDGVLILFGYAFTGLSVWLVVCFWPL